jgi:hypothetical protein
MSTTTASLAQLIMATVSSDYAAHNTMDFPCFVFSRIGLVSKCIPHSKGGFKMPVLPKGTVFTYESIISFGLEMFKFIYSQRFLS